MSSYDSLPKTGKWKIAAGLAICVCNHTLLWQKRTNLEAMGVVIQKKKKMQDMSSCDSFPKTKTSNFGMHRCVCHHLSFLKKPRNESMGIAIWKEKPLFIYVVLWPYSKGTEKNTLETIAACGVRDPIPLLPRIKILPPSLRWECWIKQQSSQIWPDMSLWPFFPKTSRKKVKCWKRMGPRDHTQLSKSQTNLKLQIQYGSTKKKKKRKYMVVFLWKFSKRQERTIRNLPPSYVCSSLYLITKKSRIRTLATDGSIE